MPLPFSGLDGATLTNAPNAGAIFSPHASPSRQRDAKGLTADAILASLRQRLSVIEDAFVITIAPPPVAGIGNAGGFKMMLQDEAGAWAGCVAGRRAGTGSQGQRHTGPGRRVQPVQRGVRPPCSPTSTG